MNCASISHHTDTIIFVQRLDDGYWFVLIRIERVFEYSHFVDELGNMDGELNTSQLSSGLLLLTSLGGLGGLSRHR